MEQSPSSKANSSSAGKEIHYILCKSRVHYCVQNSSSPVLIHSQMNPNYHHHLFIIHLNIALPFMPRSSSGLLPSCFLTRTLYASLFTTICTTPCHLYLLNVITLFGKQYKSLSSSLCNFS